MGGSGDSKIEYAQTMSPEQQNYMSSFMRAVASMLGGTGPGSGLTLGTPYGGPSTSSYTPKKFNMVPSNTYVVNGGNTQKGDKGGGGGSGGGKGGGGTGGSGDSDPGIPGGGGGGPEIPPLMAQSQNPVASFLQSLQMPSMGLTPTGPTAPISPTAMALTSPFMMPYVQGLTGNYPRMRQGV